MHRLIMLIRPIDSRASAGSMPDVNSNAVSVRLGRGSRPLFFAHMRGHSPPAVSLLLLGRVAHKILAAGQRVAVPRLTADGSGVDVV